jgi:predicted permease
VQRRYDFGSALLEKVERVPGADLAAITDRLPLEGGSNYYVKLRGQTTHLSDKLVETHVVSSDYFRALGIRQLEGRTFTPADFEKAKALEERWEQLEKRNAKPTPAETDAIVTPAVINESMARFFWPNRSPLGEMFSQGSDHGPWKQVVGVVSDVREWGLLEKPVPEAYEPIAASSRVFVVLHTQLDPTSLTSQVRQAVAQVDPGLPLFSVRTIHEVIGENVQGQQFLSLLVGSFAALAMLLAAVGIYGVLSYAVTQRRREIGIRMSLGATRGRVLGEIVREGMGLAVVGFAVGVGGAFAAGRVLGSLLHEVEPSDPVIFVGAAASLTLVALLACYLPARRAARLDPVTALRYE